MENNEMNNVEFENNMNETTYEVEPSSEKSECSASAGMAIAYGAGVVTPFVVWGIIKGVKWIVGKVRSKKAAKVAVEECEDDFSEFDEEV